MAPSARTAVTLVASLAAAYACLALLGHARERRPSVVDTLLEAPTVPADVMRRLTFGFRSAAADVQYLQAIQIYGDRAFTMGSDEEKRRRGLAIHRLLEYVTDLDPAFNYAYLFGAISVGSASLDGTMQNLTEVLALLRKGQREVPYDWRIPFHLAYYQSYFAGDFAGAAEAMAEAARRPGHPPYVELLAARLAAVGGTLDTGIAFTKAMLANASDDLQREQLEARLRLLVMEKHLRALEGAIARWREEHGGTAPESLETLVAEGYVDRVPDEPHEGRYEYDATSGTVRSSAASRLRLNERVLEAIDRATKARAPAATTHPEPSR